MESIISFETFNHGGIWKGQRPPDSQFFHNNLCNSLKNERKCLSIVLVFVCAFHDQVTMKSFGVL